MIPHRLPLSGGVEQDALTGWRRCLHWRAGERRWAKRKYNRRLRQVVRRMLKRGDAQ